MESKITFGELIRLVTGKRYFWVYGNEDDYNSTGEQLQMEPYFVFGSVGGSYYPDNALTETFSKSVVLAAKMIGKRKMAVLLGDASESDDGFDYEYEFESLKEKLFDETLMYAHWAYQREYEKRVKMGGNTEEEIQAALTGRSPSRGDEGIGYVALKSVIEVAELENEFRVHRKKRADEPGGGWIYVIWPSLKDTEEASEGI